MKRVIKSLFVLIIFMSIFTSCVRQNQPSVSSYEDTPTNKSYFIEPDKIMIYKNGKMQTISKENKLFSDIFNEMNNRLNKDVRVIRLACNKNKMKTIKQNEIVVEFVYSKNQKSVVGSREKEYSSLIFPLTGENKELCFFDNNKNDYSGPIESLKNPNVLLDLLK